MDEIKTLVEELGAKSYKKGKSWNGYEVYIPVYTGNPCIGLPLVVLVKDGQARICTGKEALEYLSFSVGADEMKPNDKLTGLGENE